MYYIITNTGDYRPLPHAKTLHDAELAMRVAYTQDEIDALEAEVCSDNEED